MCELLALSSSQPVRLSFSLHALAARSNPPGRSHDGWGVAFYQGSDVALFREPVAAADSALVQFLESRGPATELAISHIRHATQGGVALANTQPFVRELGGRSHVFAHNGDLPGIFHSDALALGPFRPVGQTDSEHAFCALLARLRPLYQASSQPCWRKRLTVLKTFAAELRRLGPANFLYADGDALFAHGDRRLQIAGGRAEAPGLWFLPRECAATPAGTDEVTGLSVAPAPRFSMLLASVPLSEETWCPFAESELRVLQSGRWVDDASA